MKVTFKPIPDGPLQFDIEAPDDVTLFEKIAHVQDLFGDTNCGCCGKTNLQFRVRKAKNAKNQEFSYYERVCTDCNAKLDYGQYREGRGLFPKRSKEDNGWYKWQSTAPAPKAVAVVDDDSPPPF